MDHDVSQVPCTTASAEEKGNRFVGLVKEHGSGKYEAAYYSGQHYPANIIAISSQVGCPVQCSHCSATKFQGQLSASELLEQTLLIAYHGRLIRVSKLPTKLSFTRLGEPSLNPAMPEFFEKLKNLDDCPVDMIQFFSILVATVNVRRNLKNFYDIVEAMQKTSSRIREIYFYISMHTTDPQIREKVLVQNKYPLMPFDEIREWIEEWFRRTEKKVTMNFARSKLYPVGPKALAKTFSADKVRVRVSELRPTDRNQATKHIPEGETLLEKLIQELREEGFEAYAAYPSPLERKYRTSVGELVRHMKPGVIPERSV